MRDLNPRQRKFLKGLAHSRKPVVTVGQKGLTEAVVEEIDHALAHHELIKIKLPAGEKSMRENMLDLICTQCRASMVTLIGRNGIVFRAAEESKISMPA